MKTIEQTIKTAMKYDMKAVMARYQEKTRLPMDVLGEHEREIKRFLALSAANPGKYGMRGPLDELWHTFILFTSAYARFCQQLGGGFIHHLPGDPGKAGRAAKKAKSRKSGYAVFLADYEKVFKEAPPAHLWPRLVGGGTVMDPSCDQCGIFCNQTCAAMELMPVAERY
jgi:hypothetical protein